MGEQFVTAAKMSEIAVGTLKSVDIEGRRLLICHTAEGFYAVDDTCTHDDGPLGEGWLEGHEIECPRHGARFDVRTGRVVCLPAPTPIRSYPVKVEGDAIKVNVG